MEVYLLCVWVTSTDECTICRLSAIAPFLLLLLRWIGWWEMGYMRPELIARVTSSAIECIGPEFNLGHWSFPPVAFFLSSVVPQQHLQDKMLVTCSLVTTPYQLSHLLYIRILSLNLSFMSVRAAWGICPSDCCPQRAPRRGQGPRSSVSRLTHGTWSRPILHGPRRWPPPPPCGGVPLQWIPFSEKKGETPLTRTSSHWTTSHIPV